MKIQPNILFAKDIQNYTVSTISGVSVRYVNLDNAATTPPLLSVQNRVNEYLTSYGSVHRGAGAKSIASTNEYERSRVVIKKFVNAPHGAYVMYTGNTTGAMNMAAHFFSFLEGKVAVSSIEHSSSWLPWVKAEGIKQLGVTQVATSELPQVNSKIQQLGKSQVVQYKVNEQFEFDLSSIEEVLKKNSIKAFVLTASSNATGYCPDIKAIGELVHRYGAYFVVDACQFIQHHSIDMQDMNIDFLAASGHKFYAPYGGGFLIGPKALLDDFLPYEIGGGNLPYITADGEFLRYANQLAHDPGTPNAVGAVAMMYAIEQLVELGIKNIEQHESTLANTAFEYLAKNKKVKLYTSKKHLNTILPFSVQGMDPQVVAERLNSEFGIGLRAGSFCVYNVARDLLDIQNDLHIVSRVRNGDTSVIPGFIRASVGLNNTVEDITRFIKAMEVITAS